MWNIFYSANRGHCALLQYILLHHLCTWCTRSCTVSSFPINPMTPSSKTRTEEITHTLSLLCIKTQASPCALCSLPQNIRCLCCEPNCKCWIKLPDRHFWLCRCLIWQKLASSAGSLLWGGFWDSEGGGIWSLSLKPWLPPATTPSTLGSKDLGGSKTLTF